MIKWIRPSGSEIETGEGKEMEAYGVSQGWKLKQVEKQEEPVRANTFEDLNTKEQIAEYLKDAGVSCDMRGSLEKVKEKALVALEE